MRALKVISTLVNSPVLRISFGTSPRRIAERTAAMSLNGVFS